MISKSVAFENYFQIQLKLYWKDVQIWCRRDSAIFILNPTSNWIWGLISRINFKYKLLCEIDEDVIIQNMIKPSQIFASINHCCKAWQTCTVLSKLFPFDSYYPDKWKTITANEISDLFWCILYMKVNTCFFQ